MITRFAPSPTGPLHLGHAFSALTAWGRAQAAGGTFLLRIEDIDTPRCRPAFEAAIVEDLRWLGLDWPEPVMRQSERMPAYRAALGRLAGLGVLYPCRCTRGDIRAALSAPQEGADALPYPGTCRGRPMAEAGAGCAIRLDIARACALAGPLSFSETGPLHEGVHAPDAATIAADGGDIVLARRDIGTSYALAVTVDDAAQGITEVVRGADLIRSTFRQLLVYRALRLAAPAFFHCPLMNDEKGERLAKRHDALSLRTLRARGVTPEEIRNRF